MKMIYFAHPVAGDDQNVVNARAWVRHLRGAYPDVIFVCQWLIDVEDGDDACPDKRAAGLERCKAQIERCDELWLYGRSVSAGMAIEASYAHYCGVMVWDFTGVNGVSPDAVGVLDMRPGGVCVD